MPTQPNLTSSNIAIRLARNLSPACEPLANMFCTASCRAWRLEMPGCSAMATCLESSDTVSAVLAAPSWIK